MTTHPTVPAGWCLGRPPAERIARLLLDQRHRELCWHLTDPREVRFSLARRWPGHLLPDVIADRDRLLVEETARVYTALGYLAEVTGLALAALEAPERPESVRGYGGTTHGVLGGSRATGAVREANQEPA